MIRGAEQRPALMVDQDRLATADGRVHDFNLMPPAAKVLNHVRREGWLELQPACRCEAARRVGSLLNVQTEVENLGEEIDVAGSLILAAHDAEGQDRAPALH